MKFEEKFSLAVNVSSPTGGFKFEPLPEGETLLVGEKCLCKWSEKVDQRGGWDNFIFPCYHNGKKAFLHRSRWWAGEGYSLGNDGQIEEIVTFPMGTDILNSKGAFDWMFEVSD